MAKKSLIGVYPTENEAVSAIKRLLEVGYENNDISVLAKNPERFEMLEDRTDIDVDSSKAVGRAAGAGAATGGILGGISSGQPIITHIALKPTSSLRLEGRTVDTSGDETTVITKGRHDPCVGIRATPIAEAMLAIVLLDHALRNRGQNSE